MSVDIKLTKMNIYNIYNSQKSWINYISEVAGSTRRLISHFVKDSHVIGSKIVEANFAAVERIGKNYEKTSWSIDDVVVDGRHISIHEEVIISKPFCKLIEFKRLTDNHEVLKKISSQPIVLIVAPLNGHYSTLLRDTVRMMLHDHNVFITDWENARDVHISAGSFGLDTYADYVKEFIVKLGCGIHVMAICQATVPTLASVSLMASAGLQPPLTLTLMAGHIDARVGRTDVCKRAASKTMVWYKNNLIYKVPAHFVGERRNVYPGFLQLFSFMSMDPKVHISAYLSNWYNIWKGNKDSVLKHEEFYNEFNSTLDVDEKFYLETIDEVYQKFSLAKGEMILGGKLVMPKDIKNCKLLIIEGADDQIVGVGQTFAAHSLCTGVIIKQYLLADDVGHYGIFSGKKWREKIYPTIKSFIGNRK